jgi:hypothetical protein
LLLDRDVSAAHAHDLVWTANKAKAFGSKIDDTQLGVVSGNQGAVCQAQRPSLGCCPSSQNKVDDDCQHQKDNRHRHGCGT